MRPRPTGDPFSRYMNVCNTCGDPFTDKWNKGVCRKCRGLATDKESVEKSQEEREKVQSDE